MVVQRAIKRYPMVKWLAIVSIALLGLGVYLSGILDANTEDNNLVLFGCLLVAIVLPFLALAFPRREVLTIELPTDTLAQRSKDELQAILKGLDEAKAAGEIDQDRYDNARAKVNAALKGK